MELKYGELGSLEQISNVLWDEMLKEIKRNGYSDFTLTLEGSVRGIKDIIRLNKINESQTKE